MAANNPKFASDSKFASITYSPSKTKPTTNAKSLHTDAAVEQLAVSEKPKIEAPEPPKPKIGGPSVLTHNPAKFQQKHQMALFIDVRKPGAASPGFCERANRMIGGSVNLPNTMKADVYLISDVILAQVKTTSKINFPEPHIAPDVDPISDDELQQFVAKMGYVGYIVVRSSSVKYKVKN